jgi:hypothetical protein
MAARQIEIQRFSVNSSKSFEEVLAAVDAAVGHRPQRVPWQARLNSDIRSDGKSYSRGR